MKKTQTSSFLRFSFLFVLFLLVIEWTSGQSLPSGFYLENVASGATFSRPVSIDFSADGKVFIAEKDGFVYVVENGQKLGTPVLDISKKVLANEERGLLSIVLDSQFTENQFIYVLYTVDIEGRDSSKSGFYIS